jgi:hypothetical protein
LAASTQEADNTFVGTNFAAFEIVHRLGEGRSRVSRSSQHMLEWATLAPLPQTELAGTHTSASAKEHTEHLL